MVSMFMTLKHGGQELPIHVVLLYCACHRNVCTSAKHSFEAKVGCCQRAASRLQSVIGLEKRQAIQKLEVGVCVHPLGT